MGTVTSIAAGKAKGTDLGTSAIGSDLQWFSAVIAVARALWPVKTAQNLAHKTQVSERAASFWLAGKYDMSLGAARELLRSEEGYAFLAALVGEDCDARWWKRVKLNASAAETRRALNEQAKKLESLRQIRQQIDLEVD